MVGCVVCDYSVWSPIQMCCTFGLVGDHAACHIPKKEKTEKKKKAHPKTLVTDWIFTMSSLPTTELARALAESGIVTILSSSPHSLEPQ